jgi:predicted  nucleic acid-binding Zn-ribbon protein
MAVVISGLDQGACSAFLGVQFADAAARWAAPESFLQLAESGAGRVEHEAERLLWLYHGPWSLRAEADAGDTSDAIALGLAQWYRHQRAALAMRRSLGARMLLVNADRVEGRAVAAELGLSADAAGTIDASLTTAEPVAEVLEQGLAKLFEWALPHYWDLFEDLEAAAWLPGGDPLFRQDLRPVTAEGMEDLMRTLQQGLRLPQTRADLADRAQALVAAQARQHAAETALEREQQALSEARTRLEQQAEAVEEHANERARLNGECERLGATVDEQRARAEALARDLESARDESRQAQHALAEAREEKARLESLRQTEAAEADARERALAAENERLCAELNQVKDALEGQSSANRALRARLARSTETLDRARVQLCRQLARGPLG